MKPGKFANGKTDSIKLPRNQNDKRGNLKPVDIYALTDGADDAGGADMSIMTMRKVPVPKGNDGSSEMFDGPYGGRAPQGTYKRGK